MLPGFKVLPQAAGCDGAFEGGFCETKTQLL
jgi:hypothetical protein